MEKRQQADRPLFYEGKEVGRIEKGRIISALTESELSKMLREELEPLDRVHLPHRAPALYLLTQHFNIPSKDYRTIEDLEIAAVEEGCKNMRDIRRIDPSLAREIYRMHATPRISRELRSA